MKITKSKLKQIIREELQHIREQENIAKLNEGWGDLGWTALEMIMDNPKIALAIGTTIVGVGAAAGAVIGRKALIDKTDGRYHDQNMRALEIAELAAANGCDMEVVVDSELRDEISAGVEADVAKKSGGLKGKTGGGVTGGARLQITNCRDPKAARAIGAQQVYDLSPGLSAIMAAKEGDRLETDELPSFLKTGIQELAQVNDTLESAVAQEKGATTGVA